MKTKPAVNFVESDQFISDLPMNKVEKQLKTNPRRESTKPKIVICPPSEDMSEATTIPRASRLLKTIRNRISRRAADSGSMGSSSSSDSVSGDNGRTNEHSSNSVSESDSDDSGRNRRHRSTVSLRRVFQSLSLSSRSLSSTASDRPRQPKKQKQPKRILRPPVTYTYVRGLSGLPTQRVPRCAVPCNSMGLNR